MINFRKRLWVFFGLFILSCQSHNTSTIKVEKAFYYWKTNFKISKKENEFLKIHNLSKIYLRFFDVDYDFRILKAVPKGKLIFSESPQFKSIIPTVFITNRVFENSNFESLDALVSQIHSSILNMASKNNIVFKEIQIDCDWTIRTKKKYFYFLKRLKEKTLKTSATIRLHQIKYFEKTGVPPVDEGILMLYNTGDWRDEKTKNSLFDAETIFGYLDNLSSYPLHLNIAFPIYQQVLVYRTGKFFVFLKEYDWNQLLNNKSFKIKPNSQVICTENIILDGISFRKDDVFKLEKAEFEELDFVKSEVFNKLHQKNTSIILFHLDEKSISQFTQLQISKIFSQN